jgi:hypothetical protein
MAGRGDLQYLKGQTRRRSDVPDEGEQREVAGLRAGNGQIGGGAG